jgi:hypothetical protein
VAVGWALATVVFLAGERLLGKAEKMFRLICMSRKKKRGKDRVDWDIDVI